MPNLDVSIVIPVFNASKYLLPLLDAFRSQTPVPPKEIILADSLSTDNTRDIVSGIPNIRVIPIPVFTHGNARNIGASQAKGDVIVILSQDALPRNSSWLASLIEPFSDASVAATFSRQIPHENAKPMEKMVIHKTINKRKHDER